ncbi:MAG TPA: hypothetical protein VGU64_21300, partial [Terriglobales bacterium]|nr:hypothetical protein [Terriglobales bacterium]
FTVSRLLREWEQRNLVISRRRYVLVKDVPSLRTLANDRARQFSARAVEMRAPRRLAVSFFPD